MKISIKPSRIDGNRAHNSKRTQVWLKKNLTGGVGEGDLASWLPLLQPFCLFCRGRLCIKGQSKFYHKTKDLIPQIKEVMGFLARNTMEKYSKRFRSQIEAVVAADGIFID